MAIGPVRPQDPQLAGWYDDVAAIRLETRTLTDGLTADQLTWRPEPGRWSIVECLDHLTVTSSKGLTHQLPAANRARAAKKNGIGPFSFGWLGSWFVGQVGPDYRRPVKNPAVFTPRSNLDPDQVKAEFEGSLTDLERFLGAADGLDLGRIKARSAASPLLRLNLAAWFAAAVAHHRRHLHQIRRILDNASFPRP
jgi:hypothetical protein